MWKCERRIELEFSKNNPHETGIKCSYCGSKIMEDIDEEHLHGMSALNDGYDYRCHSCKRLVSIRQLTEKICERNDNALRRLAEY